MEGELLTIMLTIIHPTKRKHLGDDECLFDALLGKGNNAVIDGDVPRAILGEENNISMIWEKGVLT